MKLYASLESERGKVVRKTANEFVTVQMTVHGRSIGEMELYCHDDIGRGMDTDEWLLKYRPNISADWTIVAQGNERGNLSRRR